MIKLVGKNGLILGGFALVTTSLIAVTQTITAPVIRAQQEQQLVDTLNSVLPSGLFDNDVQHDCAQWQDAEVFGTDEPVRIFRARQEQQPVAMAIETVAPNGYNGRINLLVGLTVDGTVSGVRVLNHNETPGLGDKIDLRISDWVLSFNGKQLDDSNGKQWAVKKDGGQFDQFTGATITPRAVVAAVKRAVEFANRQRDAIFAASNHCQVENNE